VKNALSRNAEELLKQIIDSHPEADDCQKLISSSLSVICGKIFMKIRL